MVIVPPTRRPPEGEIVTAPRWLGMPLTGRQAGVVVLLAAALAGLGLYVGLYVLARN